MKDLIDRLETKFKAVTTSEEDLADLVRLREQWDVSRQCLEICTKAQMHMKEETSNIDNYVTADAVQLFVLTDGKAICGRNRGLGWRTKALRGHLSDSAVQQISRDILSITFQNTGSESPPLLGNTPSTHNEGLSHKSGSEFMKRYRQGSELTSRITSATYDEALSNESGSEFMKRHGQGYELITRTTASIPLSKRSANINKVLSDVVSSRLKTKRNVKADPLVLDTAPYSKIAGQNKTSHQTKADTESLSPTDLESVFLDCLTVSFATLAGILEISATEELIKLLLNHNILHPFYELAIRKVTTEKFERHLCGFLRAYEDGLKTKAQNKAQIRASTVVRQSVRRTAREIKLAMLKPMKSQMNQSSGQQDGRRERLNLWLKSAQKLQTTSTGDSDSEFNKSNDGDMLMDENRLNSLNEVKDFLTSS